MTLGPGDAARVAETLIRFGERAAARDLIDSFMQPLTADTPDGVTIRLARLADSIRSPRAAELARHALGGAAVPPDVRDELEGIVASAGEDAPVPAPTPTPAVDDPPPPIPSAADPQTFESDVVAAVEVETARHRVEAVEAVPHRLIGETLVIEARGTSRDLSLRAVHAIAVGGVRPDDGRPYVVVDLLLDPPWSDRAVLRALRLRSNDFDPRRLVGGEQAVAAFRALLQRLLDLSEAVPLPDPESAIGNPFKMYDSVETYEREVLRGA